MNTGGGEEVERRPTAAVCTCRSMPGENYNRGASVDRRREGRTWGVVAERKDGLIIGIFQYPRLPIQHLPVRFGALKGGGGAAACSASSSTWTSRPRAGVPWASRAEAREQTTASAVFRSVAYAAAESPIVCYPRGLERPSEPRYVSAIACWCGRVGSTIEYLLRMPISSFTTSPLHPLAESPRRPHAPTLQPQDGAYNSPDLLRRRQ